MYYYCTAYTKEISPRGERCASLIILPLERVTNGSPKQHASNSSLQILRKEGVPERVHQTAIALWILYGLPVLVLYGVRKELKSPVPSSHSKNALNMKFGRGRSFNCLLV